MARSGRYWTVILLPVLLSGTVAVGFAQSLTGSLAGHLTDLHSHPLEGAAVILSNLATGAELRATTTKNGSYRFTSLKPGEYALEAEIPQLGRGVLDGIVVTAGHEARIQAAMEFEPFPPQPTLAARRGLEPQAPAIKPALPAEPIAAMPVPLRIPLPAVHPMPITPLPQLDVALASGPLPELLALPSRQFPPATALPASFSAATAMVSAAAAAALFAAQPLRATIHQAPQSAEAAAPATANVITGEQLQSLPLSGRNWREFVLDTPTTESGGSQPRLSGAGQESAGISLDGAATGLAFIPQESPSQTGSWNAARRRSILSETSIREVRAFAGNVEPAGVRSASGRIDVETRRGDNGFHGQGFFFSRQNLWGAQNPFTQWVRYLGAAASPAFATEPYTPGDSEFTWGVGLGSRIRRNKLFWFAALDGYRRSDPGLGAVKHPAQFFAQPTEDEMQVLCKRLLAPGKGCGSDPASEGLGRYSTELGNLTGLLGPAPRTATQWSGFGRVDWEAAERHRFTLEGTGAGWNAPGGGLTRVSEPYGNHSFGSTVAGESWLLGRWEAFVTPNLLAVTQASAGRTILGTHPGEPSTYEAPFLGPNLWGQLPQVVVDSRYGFTIGNPTRFGAGSYPDERHYLAQESVNWVRGGLLVKAGLSFNRNADSISLLRNQTGTFTYAHLENFISDALAFHDFGISGMAAGQHNCDETGTVWRDSGHNLRGQGGLPCYSYYTQTLGPADWRLSTNDWAGYASAQWQPSKRVVVSAGLRWDRQQLPPPLTALFNPDLPLTQRLPNLGNNWSPRFSMAWGRSESHWPVLRLGYGIYFPRTENATLETALTQTGSLHGDLHIFVRPTDGLNSATGTSAAPPFPYVLTGDPLRVVKPGAVQFNSRFRNPQVHQAVVAMEESLPGHLVVTASAMASLGRRLPIAVNTNLAPPPSSATITYDVKDSTGKGPIKAGQITVPFYASWATGTAACPYYQPTTARVPGWLCPDYQQITSIDARANSTYEAAMLRVARYGHRGLSLHARYTYSHAMDWNPNESTLVSGSDLLDPANFGLEYGTSNLDVRHSASVMALWQAPWKLHGAAGRLANGWMISGIAQFRSGRPYTMRTEGSLARIYQAGSAVVGLGPGMNGSGGDTRIYGLGSDGVTYNIGRNTFRYPATWKADLRLGKRIQLGGMRQLELLAESFNLFNHQNVTELETIGYSIEPGTSTGGFPSLNYLAGIKANSTAFGQPLNINSTNFYRARQLQLGMRLRF